MYRHIASYMNSQPYVPSEDKTCYLYYNINHPCICTTAANKIATGSSETIKI